MTRLLFYCRKLDGYVYAAQRWLLIVLCIAITAISIAQVAGRYLFIYSIPWSEQLSIVLFILLIFLGQNLATKHDNEIRIELFLFASKNVQRIVLAFADVLCLIVVATLFLSSVYFVMHALAFPQVISSLQLPYFYVFSVMPVGFLLIFFSRLGVLLRRFYPLPDEAYQESEELP